ncbi:MAG: hypothetical protein WAW75_05995 [Gallionella sp.]
MQIAALFSPGKSARLLSGLLLGGVLLFFAAWAGAAEEAPITVLYPDIGEPYRGIFEKIIEGIKAKVDVPLTHHALRAGTDIDELRTSLKIRNTKVVIALGRQGMKAATPLNNGIKVVVGGVLTVPKSELSKGSIISLAPDPALLFAHMKELVPKAKRVFVVYDPDYNDWLIALAEESARAQGLELVARKATDLRSATQFYQDFFSGADAQTEILWLPQDATTVDENLILPLVLRESWRRNIAVFSSSVGHVVRGVLFSMYPDNVAMGRSLGGLAQDMISGGRARYGIRPLRDLHSAINLRTAKHLALNLNPSQSFDSAYPEP